MASFIMPSRAEILETMVLSRVQANPGVSHVPLVEELGEGTVAAIRNLVDRGALRALLGGNGVYRYHLPKSRRKAVRMASFQITMEPTDVLWLNGLIVALKQRGVRANRSSIIRLALSKLKGKRIEEKDGRLEVTERDPA